MWSIWDIFRKDKDKDNDKEEIRVDVDAHFQEMLRNGDKFKEFADRDCKVCFGRGYIHYNSTHGFYQPCNCTEERLKDKFNELREEGQDN